MSAISYRRPMPEEAVAFAALHVQCWRESYRDYVPPELMASFSTEKRLPMWEAVLATAERIVIGAYADGAPCGFIIAGASPEKLIEKQDGHVWALYIAKAQHRRGIGRMLMSLVAQKWLGRGGHSFTIGVLRANEPARAFYEELGSVLVMEGIYDWDGSQLADCVYFLDTAHLLELAAARKSQPPV